MPPRREDETVIKWLKENGLQVGSILVAIGASSARSEYRLNEMERKHDDLCKEVRDFRAGGPSGLVSPSAAGIFDLHIAGWLDRHLGRKGSLKLIHDYATVEEEK